MMMMNILHSTRCMRLIKMSICVSHFRLSRFGGLLAEVTSITNHVDDSEDRNALITRLKRRGSVNQ